VKTAPFTLEYIFGLYATDRYTEDWLSTIVPQKTFQVDAISRHSSTLPGALSTATS